MEADLRARLRGFGLGLGVLLLVLAWRSPAGSGRAPALVAGALASFVSAWAYPPIFSAPYRLWMPAVRILARVNSWIVCAVLYHLVLTPYAIVARLMGARFLETELRVKESYWNVKPPRDPAESARRAF